MHRRGRSWKRGGGGGGGGFSALELLWVLTLTALLAALALPAAGRARTRAAVAGARDAFAMLFARARLEAVAHGRVARLEIDAERNRASLSLAATGAGGAAPLDAVLDFGAEFRGVRITSGRRVLCFSPRGLPTAAGDCELPTATVRFRLGTEEDTVTISVAGRLLKR